MNQYYTDQDIGIKKGTQFRLRKPFHASSGPSESRLLSVGEIVTFNFAINLHWDGLDSFHFLTAKGENLVIDFKDELSKDAILELLFNDYVEPLLSA